MSPEGFTAGDVSLPFDFLLRAVTAAYQDFQTLDRLPRLRSHWVAESCANRRVALRPES
ncbi:hypothetical protein [Phycicoccus sp. Soil803]|uniref:hypothetical protein n=1 Tax=Phycicoccus sp. Soil803 TaxID=1736415 RepID=UPI000AAE7AC9|nr:hypothetical protein [Phycicoccus sp. Soil803]